MSNKRNQAHAVTLRMRRASRHLDEIDDLVKDFVDAGPFQVSETRDPATGGYIYRVELTGTPSEDIPVVVGDFLHNLRSALNYLMIGMLPPSLNRLQYPLYENDPFRRVNGSRKFVDRDARGRNFWRTLEGALDRRALALVKDYQPFSLGTRSGKVNMLAMLSRLSNADKHRRLALVSPGLEAPSWVLDLGDKRVFKEWDGLVMPANQELLRTTAPTTIELCGTPIVTLQVRPPEGKSKSQDVRIDALRDLYLFVSGFLVEPLLGYVR